MHSPASIRASTWATCASPSSMVAEGSGDSGEPGDRFDRHAREAQLTTYPEGEAVRVPRLERLTETQAGVTLDHDQRRLEIAIRYRSSDSQPLRHESERGHRIAAHVGELGELEEEVNAELCGADLTAELETGLESVGRNEVVADR